MIVPLIEAMMTFHPLLRLKYECSASPAIQETVYKIVGAITAGQVSNATCNAIKLRPKAFESGARKAQAPKTIVHKNTSEHGIMLCLQCANTHCEAVSGPSKATGSGTTAKPLPVCGSMVVKGKAATRAPSSSSMGCVTALKNELCTCGRGHSNKRWVVTFFEKAAIWAPSPSSLGCVQASENELCTQIGVKLWAATGCVEEEVKTTHKLRHSTGEKRLECEWEQGVGRQAAQGADIGF
eukprot:1156044-Pelagomonas_calceolata.AAC.8